MLRCHLSQCSVSQVHWPFTDKNTKELEPPYKETWQAMEELVELVRSWLISLKQS